jgi:hypothetical protein
LSSSANWWMYHLIWPPPSQSRWPCTGWWSILWGRSDLRSSTVYTSFAWVHEMAGEYAWLYYRFLAAPSSGRHWGWCSPCTMGCVWVRSCQYHHRACSTMDPHTSHAYSCWLVFGALQLYMHGWSLGPNELIIGNRLHNTHLELYIWSASIRGSTFIVYTLVYFSALYIAL